MPRKDLNQTAFSIVQRATDETPPEPIDEKKKAAQDSGLRGGLLGGTASARALDAQQRSDVAKKAALKRWKGC